MGDDSDAVTMAQNLEHMANFFARSVLDSVLTRHLLTDIRVYDSGQYSDLTIRCGSRTWKVHRVIVYAASNFFLKAGEGAFQVRKNSHCPTRPILHRPHPPPLFD